MAHARFALPLFAVALALPACDSGNKPAAKQPPASGAAPAAPSDKAPEADKPADPVAKAEAAGDPAGDKVKVVEGAAGGDDRYALQIEPPTDAKAGQAGKAVVKVVPKEPWHMNLDYPTSLKLEAPEALAVTNTNLKKADAKLDDKGCEFAVDFTPASAGEHAVTGKFKFAVCKDEACSPVTEEVEFKVAVK